MPLVEVQCRRRFPGGFELAADFASDHRFTALFGPSGQGNRPSFRSSPVSWRRTRATCGWAAARSWTRKACAGVPIHRRRVGVVFQDGLLFPHLTVGGNLRYGRRRARKCAIELPRVMEMLEIGGLLDRYPRNLSGGENTRVALGRALLSGPDLLLMDEPLASLDAPLGTKILACLERVVAQWDIPVLFVTHSQLEVRRASQWVVVLEKGRVVAAGTPEEALGQPELLAWSNATGPVNLLRLDRIEAVDGGLQGWIGPQRLVLPPRASSLPPPRFIQFSPRELILSRRDISGISARNHLRGQLCRLVRSHQAVFAAIDMGQSNLGGGHSCGGGRIGPPAGDRSRLPAEDAQPGVRGVKVRGSSGSLQWFN